ncbi:MAG: NAD(P)-dependent oxidoreductase [Candidatus Rokubacteria bacterium]|nr:NAD(P)-dependent oxidoreductase [Candidatus Rokubacteria bacterium]
MTGASGFIGSHLVEALGLRHEVVVLARTSRRVFPRRPVRAVVGDLGDVNALRDATRRTDVVVHLAGLKQCDPGDIAKAIETNINGTQALLRAAREAGTARFVFASTYLVYGRRVDEELPCREDDELRPHDVYGMTKALAERLVEGEALNPVILRLGHVYGGDASKTDMDVVSAFIQSGVDQGALRVFGSGKTTIDPIHVDDVCQCIEQLLDAARPVPRILNVASGVSWSITQIAEQVAAAARAHGCPVAIVHEGADHRATFSKAVAIDRLRAVLPGFSPRALGEGIEACLATLTPHALVEARRVPSDHRPH